MEATDLSRDWPLIIGVTEACLNSVGNLPSVKERFAKYTIISENILLQCKRREVGIMSIVDDLAGEKLRTRVTSAAVTGNNMLRTEPAQITVNRCRQ